MAKRKIRMVRWVDSCMCHAQVDASEFPTPVKIVSVGIVVAETKRYITLSRDLHADGDCRSLICIPRCSVLKVKVL